MNQTTHTVVQAFSKEPRPMIQLIPVKSGRLHHIYKF